ncbi:UNVERIFIED_CONTAM: hypothetical protein RMT77_007507 [Armadillidium vulgare]
MKPGILNDLDVHPRVIAAARRVGITTSWRVLEHSLGELKTKTGLNPTDTERLMDAAALQCCPPFLTGSQILQKTEDRGCLLISTGCPKLDEALGGGVPCVGLTELAGESGSGKTQFGLQLALQCQLPVALGGLGKSVAYICTETQFPVSRLNQLISFRKNQKTFNKKGFSDNIFVHHLPDMDNLVDCVHYQLPQFVSQRAVGLVIIDSVAAVFRAAEEPQELKSKMVKQLGYRLRQLADQQNVAILAINQVTAMFGGNTHGIIDDDLVPALGLSWTNLVTTRIMLRNTSFVLQQNSSEESSKDQIVPKSIRVPEIRVRSLDILFCPWLPRKSSPFIVTEEGIKDTETNSITMSCN